MRAISVVLSLLTWSLAPSPAPAAVLRVPTEYSTIQQAIDAAVSGDSVLVAPGTYTNCDGVPCTPRVAILKGGVSLLSEGGRDVTTLRVDRPAGGASVVRGSGIVAGGVLLKGFTITATAPGYLGASFLDCSDVRVEECEFVDLDPGVELGAGITVNGSVVAVHNCVFRRCRASLEGAGYTDIGGIDVLEGCVLEECDRGGASLNGIGGSSAVVRDCVFRNNTGNPALMVVTMPEAEISGNTFEDNSNLINAAAVLVGSPEGSTVVTNNLFVRNDATQFRGVLSWRSTGEIRGNTFCRNVTPANGGVVYDFSDPATGTAVTSSNNIFTENSGGPAYRAQSTPPEANCNLFWSNPGGDYVGYVPAPTDLFVDPLFCDPENSDFHLMSDSPCLPENSGVCGLIGAFGNGCGTVSVDPASWARVKGSFR